MMPLEERIYQNESQLRQPLVLVRAMWADLWQSRKLGWALAQRDIKAKYRAAWLVLTWAVLPPVATTLMFVVLQRGQVFETSVSGVPYPLFVMAGVVFWQLFADAVSAPLQMVQASRSMLTRILFPREALLVSAVLQVSFNFLIKLGLFGLLLAWYQVALPSTIWLIPLAALMLLGLGILLGVLLVPVGILYQDVLYSLGIILMLLMFITPVGFAPPQSGILADITQWNPVAPLIQCARDWALTGASAAAIPAAWVALGTVVGLAFGWVLYRLTFPIAVERLSS
jgi:lipopolysaccharide transport system permease protein